MIHYLLNLVTFFPNRINIVYVSILFCHQIIGNMFSNRFGRYYVQCPPIYSEIRKLVTCVPIGLLDMSSIQSHCRRQAIQRYLMASCLDSLDLQGLRSTSTLDGGLLEVQPAGLCPLWGWGGGAQGRGA